MVYIPGLYFVIVNDQQARFVRPDPANNPHTIRRVDRDELHQPAVPSSPDGYAAALARIIDEEFAADLFSHLVLVAPPRLLAELTAAFGTPTRDSLLGSLPADLVAIPDDRLRAFLEHWLPPVVPPCD